MSQLQSILQLASVALVSGLYFTSTAVYAVQMKRRPFNQPFKIILGNKTICNNNRGMGCVANGDTNNDLTKITFGTTANPFLITSGSNTWETVGTLDAFTDEDAEVPGVDFHGVILRLSEFTLKAKETNNLALFPIPTIKFQNNFTKDFTLSPLNGFNIIGGDWISKSLGDTVNRKDILKLNSSIFKRSNDEKLADLLEVTSDSPPVSETTAPLYEGGDKSQKTPNLDNTNSRLDNPKIVGEFKDSKLAPGETLSLPHSACIVVVEENLTEDEVKKICNQGNRVAIPEPSSALGLLALGALRTTSLLTRKQKPSQQDKG
ncbi:MAG: PEP-CTERM sorting domain-containing protein [Microcystaceae cyanobacterium]